MALTVRPGETVRVDQGQPGRALIGQAVPDQPGRLVDWLNDPHWLHLKQPLLRVEDARQEDYASFVAFNAAHHAAYESPERRQLVRDARSYPLAMGQDGSFRIEDVPPGTYELRIGLTDPRRRDETRSSFTPINQIGSLTREVIVPAGDEPLDLGTLTVGMREGSDMPVGEPLELAGTMSDGAAFSLAQLKGLHVVLVFWAPWSGKSVDQWTEVARLRAEHARNPHVAFVGVSFGENPAETRDVVAARGVPQLILDAENRVRAAAAFDLNRIPAVFLVDPESRIVGRELVGDRLAAALRRALTP